MMPAGMHHVAGTHPSAGPPALGSGPFYITFISGNISVCAGCHARYAKPVLPPHNLCLKHQEWREFTLPNNPAVQRRFGNAYYHPCFTCVRSRWPYAQCGDIVLEDDTQQRLSQEHKDYLYENLGLSLW